MAQLAPRASQLLPTVKCSSCGLPVALSDLGDHVCPPQPPLPTFSPSKAILEKIRSQNDLRQQSSAPSQQRSNPPPMSQTPVSRPPMAPVQSSRMPEQRPAQRGASPMQQQPQPQRLNNPPPHSQNPLSQRAQFPASARPTGAPSMPSQHLTARPQQTPNQPRPQVAPVPRSMDNRRPPMNGAQIPQPSVQEMPPTPQTSSMYNFPTLDTKSGGEAGMAGVGRRGFQAAAQAALFAASANMRYGSPATGATPPPEREWQAPSMDGRRANAPRYLDISTQPGPAHSTPPLSPNSGYSSVSPHSPLSQSPISGLQPAIASSRTPSPTSQSFVYPRSAISPRKSSDSTPRASAVVPESSTSTVALSVRTRTPSDSRLDHQLARNVSPKPRVDTALPSAPLSPDSGSDYGGLAYDDDDSVAAFSPSSPNLRASKSESAVIGRRKGLSGVRFPSLGDTMSSAIPSSIPAPSSPPNSASNISPHARPSPSTSLSKRYGRLSPSPSSASSSSGRSSKSAPSARPGILIKSKPGPPPSRSASDSSSYSRSTTRSMGALDSAMDTVFEGITSPPSAMQPLPPLPNKKSTSPLTHVNSLPSHPLSPQDRLAKLPTRSRTTPALSSTKSISTAAEGTAGGEEKKVKHRVRDCARCDKRIDDGRWIKADGAGVLCERCWKMMYLPKCRRCNRPIEKQAVSSADGQLKGKYHRECFNCSTCQIPFPDKEFYVFDGKPFCRFHYHEANDSLCASKGCGQPIEGACAVAHTGERFHPEHLVCEYEYEYRDPALRGRLGVVMKDEDIDSFGISEAKGKIVRCGEKLEEYWEIDGRMLCERHAAGTDSDDERSRSLLRDKGERNARAIRRITQLIDLR